MPFHFFLFSIILLAILFAQYLLGYFSSSSKVEVKSPNQSVVYKNNMQKTMDRLKGLLLSDSKIQNAEKKNDFLEKEIKEIAEKFTVATPSNPS